MMFESRYSSSYEESVICQEFMSRLQRCVKAERFAEKEKPIVTCVVLYGNPRLQWGKTQMVHDEKHMNNLFTLEICFNSIDS